MPKKRRGIEGIPRSPASDRIFLTALAEQEAELIAAHEELKMRQLAYDLAAGRVALIRDAIAKAEAES